MMKRINPEIFHLGIFSLFTLGLLGFRVYYAGNPAFLFLAWNIALAWIPYLAAFMISRTQPAGFRLGHLGLLVLWLSFLPNAPYLITDMVHLKPRENVPYWYDTFMIFAFALNGMVLFYASCKKIWVYLKAINPMLPGFVIPVCFGLCAYGVYMGRWLRLNTWDAFFHPFRMTKTLVYHAMVPSHLTLIIQVTCMFGILLYITFRSMMSLK
jgi:uncharacterized membrane protein